MKSSVRYLSSLAAVFTLSFALTACEGEVSIGEKTIASEELEQQSADTLEQKFDERPASIDCPEDLKAEVGATETCELVDQSGNHYDMEVTVTSVDDDGNAKFDIKVGEIKEPASTPS